MGTWGPQVHENDTALDFIGSIIERLKETIVIDLDSAVADGILERPVLAAVACLSRTITLLPDPAQYISREEAFAWQDRYLTWFDSNAEEFGAEEEFLKQARACAEAEFSKLTRLLAESN